MIRLTPEQSEHASQHPRGFECQAEGSEQTFVIMDAGIAEEMRRAFYRKESHESLTRAIDDMQSGRTMSVDEAETRLRDEMGFTSRSAT